MELRQLLASGLQFKSTQYDVIREAADRLCPDGDLGRALAPPPVVVRGHVRPDGLMIGLDGLRFLRVHLDGPLSEGDKPVLIVAAREETP